MDTTRQPQYRILVIQHIVCEPPAAYEDVLHDRAIHFHRVEIDEGQPLPDWREFAAIIAMGGPMCAHDDEEFPWLPDERRLLADAVRAGVPYWGVCLGAQLLASALGARVFRGQAPEVGIYRDIELTKEAAQDPVFRHVTGPLTSLQWHSDTFDLPHEAVLLAGSPAYRHQAFRWGNAYGLQFHLEVSPDLATKWAAVPAYADALDQILGPGSLPRLVADLTSVAPGTLAQGQALFSRWLDDVVEPAVSRTRAGLATARPSG
jgi:GMP synthase-like glutamine amidotransferase